MDSSQAMKALDVVGSIRRGQTPLAFLSRSTFREFSWSKVSAADSRFNWGSLAALKSPTLPNRWHGCSCALNCTVCSRQQFSVGIMRSTFVTIGATTNVTPFQESDQLIWTNVTCPAELRDMNAEQQRARR